MTFTVHALDHEPLRKCRVQEMWTGGGILLPCTLLVPSDGWA
jgi:hypothetical protein